MCNDDDDADDLTTEFHENKKGEENGLNGTNLKNFIVAALQHIKEEEEGEEGDDVYVINRVEREKVDGGGREGGGGGKVGMTNRMWTN